MSSPRTSFGDAASNGELSRETAQKAGRAWSERRFASGEERGGGKGNGNKGEVGPGPEE